MLIIAEGIVADVDPEFRFAEALAPYARRYFLSELSAADVKRVATALLRPDRLKLVLVGDKKTFGPGLEGLKLGKAEARLATPEETDTATVSV